MKLNNLIPCVLLFTTACSAPADQPDAAPETVQADERQEPAAAPSGEQFQTTASSEKPYGRQAPQSVPPKEKTVRFVPPIIVDEMPEDPPFIDEAWENTKTSAGSDDFWGMSEKSPKIVAMPEKTEIYEIVEEPAEFPGGMVALKKYITENLRYPESAKELAIEGRCYLKFVVSTEGDISDIRVMRGVADCPECDKEAIRMVKGMPDWKPAKNRGEAVGSYFNLPVSFKLQ